MSNPQIPRHLQSTCTLQNRECEFSIFGCQVRVSAKCDCCRPTVIIVLSWNTDKHTCREYIRSWRNMKWSIQHIICSCLAVLSNSFQLNLSKRLVHKLLTLLVVARPELWGSRLFQLEPSSCRHRATQNYPNNCWMLWWRWRLQCSSCRKGLGRWLWWCRRCRLPVTRVPSSGKFPRCRGGETRQGSAKPSPSIPLLSTLVAMATSSVCDCIWMVMGVVRGPTSPSSSLLCGGSMMRY